MFWMGNGHFFQQLRIFCQVLWEPAQFFFRQRLNLPEFGPLPATCGNVLPLTLSLPFSHSPLSRLISSTLCNALVLHWTSIQFETKLELEFDQPASNSHPGSALSGIFSFPRISRSVPVAKIGSALGKTRPEIGSVGWKGSNGLPNNWIRQCFHNTSASLPIARSLQVDDDDGPWFWS